MNKLRKFGFLVLAVVCALFALVSCGEPKGPTAAEAAARISTTQDKKVVSGDFVVNNSIVYEGVTFTVTWESNNKVATIGTEKVDANGVAKENGGFYLVSIAYSTNYDADQTVTLTATVANGDDKATKSITFTVPQFKTLSYAEFAAAADDESVAVQGIVTGIISKDSKGNSSNALYVNGLESDGGFYVYGLTNDPVAAGIKEGMKVLVAGQKDTYNGTLEIVNASVSILDETIATVTPVDLTDAYKAAADLKADSLVGKQALLVTVKGVTITTQNTESGYYNFKLGELESYVRISSSVCPLTADQQKEFIKGHTEHAGWIANVTGVVCVYNGAFYLTPVTENAFEYVSLPELSDAEEVAAEKANISISKTVFEENVEFDVPVVGKSYSDVKIAWTSNSEQVVIDNEKGKVSITLGKEKVTVKLTATITSGEATDTKEFELTLYPLSEDLFVTSVVEAPVAATAYKLAIGQTKAGKTVYLTGEADARYLLSTENVANAVDFYLEAVEGGYKIYWLNGEVKTYIHAYVNDASKDSAGYTTETPSVWAYDTTFKMFTTTLGDKTVYLGTYNTYLTAGVSASSYVKEDNIDVSQFPVRCYAAQKAEYVGKVVEAPAAATAYKLAIGQTKAGKTVYLTGEADARYLLSTENVANAVDFYLEAVEGGYKIYWLNGEVKTYIHAYVNDASKDSAGYTTETPSVWAYDTTFKMFTTTLGDKTVYLGTYNTYLTAGVSASSYVKEDNIDVSQFPVRCYELELQAVEGGNEDTPTETPETPE